MALPLPAHDHPRRPASLELTGLKRGAGRSGNSLSSQQCVV